MPAGGAMDPNIQAEQSGLPGDEQARAEMTEPRICGG